MANSISNRSIGIVLVRGFAILVSIMLTAPSSAIPPFDWIEDGYWAARQAIYDIVSLSRQRSAEARYRREVARLSPLGQELIGKLDSLRPEGQGAAEVALEDALPRIMAVSGRMDPVEFGSVFSLYLTQNFLPRGATFAAADAFLRMPSANPEALFRELIASPGGSSYGTQVFLGALVELVPSAVLDQLVTNHLVSADLAGSERARALVGSVFMPALRDRRGPISVTARREIVRAFIRSSYAELLSPERRGRLQDLAERFASNVDLEVSEGQMHSLGLPNSYYGAWILAPISDDPAKITNGYDLGNLAEFLMLIEQVGEEVRATNTANQRLIATASHVLSHSFAFSAIEQHYQWISGDYLRPESEKLAEADRQLVSSLQRFLDRDGVSGISEIESQIFHTFAGLDMRARMSAGIIDPVSFARALSVAAEPLVRRYAMYFLAKIYEEFAASRWEFAQRRSRDPWASYLQADSDLATIISAAMDRTPLDNSLARTLVMAINGTLNPSRFLILRHMLESGNLDVTNAFTAMLLSDNFLSIDPSGTNRFSLSTQFDQVGIRLALDFALSGLGLDALDVSGQPSIMVTGLARNNGFMTGLAESDFNYFARHISDDLFRLIAPDSSPLADLEIDGQIRKRAFLKRLLADHPDKFTRIASILAIGFTKASGVPEAQRLAILTDILGTRSIELVTLRNTVVEGMPGMIFDTVLPEQAFTAVPAVDPCEGAPGSGFTPRARRR